MSHIWPEDRHLHRRGRIEERELECLSCGHTWIAEGREEYGIWIPIRDDDLSCPECGIEAE